MVRAVMALEPGAVHAPGRTGLLHWLHTHCHGRGWLKNVPEEHVCADLLFTGAAHLYLLFVQGTPVCDCGGLAMCCIVTCRGMIPAVQTQAGNPCETATTSGQCVAGM